MKEYLVKRHGVLFILRHSLFKAQRAFVSKTHLIPIGIIGLLFFSAISYSEESMIIQSGETSPALLELYSSQGCSSCPPAQSWVNRFKDSPDLWDKVIPMVFHVDYWDYIGWEDPFASAEFSNRQRYLKRSQLVKSVYTPGFVVNGKEWKGWFVGMDIPLTQSNQVPSGVLTAELTKTGAQVSFSQVKGEKEAKYLNIALLGFELSTEVKRGENANSTLNDNFVVLGFEQYVYEGEDTFVPYPQATVEANKYAVAIWLSTQNRYTPVQSLGGFLPSDWEL